MPSRFHPDAIAVAQMQVDRHRGEAPAMSRSIAEQHHRDESPDADFWADVAAVVESITSR